MPTLSVAMLGLNWTGNPAKEKANDFTLEVGSVAQWLGRRSLAGGLFLTYV